VTAIRKEVRKKTSIEEYTSRGRN